MFITAVSYAIVKGHDIECGCDITGGSKVSWLLVGMDSGLLIMSLACMVARTPMGYYCRQCGAKLPGSSSDVCLECATPVQRSAHHDSQQA